jgi:acyl-CoA synthetase (AMP-forming)/AMP-acid ligase II
MTDKKQLWLQSYDPWVNPEIDVRNVTVKDLIDHTDKNFPERPAIHFFDETWNYSKFMDKADRFACALADHGIEKGDVLAINLVNCPQYLIALCGAIKAGVIVSGLSPLLMQEEMKFQLSDLGAKAVITHDYLFDERLSIVASKLEHLSLIIVTGLLDLTIDEVAPPEPKVLPGAKVLWLKDLFLQYPANPIQVEINPEDVCAIQYTGGTTGVPKGAVLTHHNVAAMEIQLKTWVDIENGKDILLLPFPMFHIAGFFHSIQGLCFGLAQVIIPDPRKLDHIIQQMRRHKPSLIGLAPLLISLLLKEPDFHRLDFTNLKYCSSGSAPVPIQKAKELETVMGANKLAEVYGLTETCSQVTANPRDGIKKVGSVGIPLPSTRLKLVDLDSGEKEVPQGEEGEIIVNGPQVTKGYFNKPKETRIAFRKHDGEIWFHTGDVARMDEDGYFFIVDRIKDMINVGGYKVFSNELEHKFSKHPAIEQCAIVGVSNPDRPGSELVKLVVVKSKTSANEDDESVKKNIIAFAREKMAPYKVPKVVEFRETMPLTPVGKIDKKALRK